LQNLFIVFVSFFVVIVLIEVYLHLAQPAFLELNTSIVGDLTDFKSQGHLHEQSFLKEKGAFRILGLGDSFATNDCHLQKNYHDFLAAAFQAAGYKHIEVLNAGIPAVGPGYYWHVLKKYGDSWKPDLVLVGFFVGNDFEEFEFIMHRGPFIREPLDPWRRWRGYLQFRNFWVYKVVKGKLIITQEKRRKAQERKETAGDREGSFSQQTYLDVEKDRMWIFKKGRKADLDELWQKSADPLLKIKKWCDRRQIPLIIAIFPDQFQVDEKLRQEIYQTYHLAADDFDLAYPNRFLQEYCRDHDIYCLDMLAPFQQQEASQDLYKIRDSHWNEAGNRLAARLIFDYLTQNGLLRQQAAALEKR